MKTTTLAVAALIALAGCSSGGRAPAAAGGAVAGNRTAALHRAADCVRQHGIPAFHDPAVGANGQVFTDTRPLEDAGDTVLRAARQACQSLISAANWNPDQQPPAPPALVAAGARAAQCMRQHGLPNFKDPTANSVYTPGHGFGIEPDDLPAGADKETPIVAQAATACRTLLDAERVASTLDQLAGK
jgi:hypothetical protein